MKMSDALSLLREGLCLIQQHDNVRGDCTSGFCDGQVEVDSRKTIHPHDPECWFERVRTFLKDIK